MLLYLFIILSLYLSTLLLLYHVIQEMLSMSHTIGLFNTNVQVAVPVSLITEEKVMLASQINRVP